MTTLDREGAIRLAVGAAVALLLHAVMLPSLSLTWDFSSNGRARAERPASASADPVQPRERDPSELEKPTPPQAQEPELRIGREDSPLPTSVAWISHEDFQELIAPQAVTLQPAVQSLVDPLPEAPTPLEPTPPGITSPTPVPQASPPPTSPTPPPQAQASEPPQAPAAQRTEAATPKPVDEGAPQERPAAQAPPSDTGEPVEQLAALPPNIVNAIPGETGLPDSPGSERLSLEPQLDAQGPRPDTAKPLEQIAAQSPDPAPALQPAIQQDAAQGDQPQGEPATSQSTTQATHEATDLAPVSPPTPRDSTPAPTAPASQATPTSAPRTDFDSPPTRPDSQELRVRPGSVITAQGIEIKTAVPRLSVVARSSSAPDNPRVRVTFNRRGEVVNADVVKSSGFVNIDGPILASLYRWRASGKRLEEVRETFSLEIELLFNK